MVFTHASKVRRPTPSLRHEAEIEIIPTPKRFTHAQIKLVKEHIKLAEGIARTFLRTEGGVRYRDDLRSAALEGLCQAALRYDDGRGVPFYQYASRRIDGAVRDEFRRHISPRNHPEINLTESIDTSTLPNHLIPRSSEKVDDIIEGQWRVIQIITSIRHARAREVAIEYWLNGCEQQEIANDMGIDYTRVSQLWRQARKEMAEFLAEQEAKPLRLP